jgi:hypothetical protein
MSALTLRVIMNDSKYVTKYSDFINDIERQMEKTPNIYYINKVYPVSLYDEITIKVLNSAINKYAEYISQEIKTHIPFTEKEKMNPYLYTLK